MGGDRRPGARVAPRLPKGPVEEPGHHDVRGVVSPQTSAVSVLTIDRGGR